jgi:hypothetical protein
MSDDCRWAEQQLSQLEPGEVFLAVEKQFHATWFSYRGRHHYLWLLPASGNRPPLPTPSHDTPVYFLVEDPLWPIHPAPDEGTLLGRQGRFSLWRWRGVPSL